MSRDRPRQVILPRRSESERAAEAAAAARADAAYVRRAFRRLSDPEIRRLRRQVSHELGGRSGCYPDLDEVCPAYRLVEGPDKKPTWERAA